MVDAQLDKANLSLRKVFWIVEAAYGNNFDIPKLKKLYKQELNINLTNIKLYTNEVYLYFDFGTIKRKLGKNYIKLDDVYVKKHFTDKEVADGPTSTGGYSVKYNWEEVKREGE